ncbi:MAG: peptidylprolyl isomerase [Saprospiraceae bacterium]|nr:peptidylprolyl isomerase [Saprospiraceae bacterium]
MQSSTSPVASSDSVANGDSTKLAEENTKTGDVLNFDRDSVIVVLETDLGTMEILLFDNTPEHKRNFLELVQRQYYDDLLFHRVIGSFMIQGGDPNSKNANKDTYLGEGGPDYTIKAEFNTDNLHFKGALAAARMSDQTNPQKRSSGSQFYIVQGSKVDDKTLDHVETYRRFEYTEEQRKLYKINGGTPHLDLDYTVFGKVISGLEVIDKIAQVACNSRNRPLENIRMKITVKP